MICGVEPSWLCLQSGSSYCVTAITVGETLMLGTLAGNSTGFKDCFTSDLVFLLNMPFFKTRLHV